MNKKERKEFAKIAASFGDLTTSGIAGRLATVFKDATALGRKEMSSLPQPTDLNRFLLPNER